MPTAESTSRADATFGTASAPTPRELPPLPAGWRSLASAFVASARRRPRAPALVDSTGESIDYGEALLRSFALARVLDRLLGVAEYVGVMVPPTVNGALANIALAHLGRRAVNLNYTASKPVVDSALAQCAARKVITSRRVIDKFKIEPAGDLIFLEDLRKQVTKRDGAIALASARYLPRAALGLVFPGLRGDRLAEPATVIFTSGSTGDPKGVVLTHRNVLSNIHQFNIQVGLGPDEVVVGVLPFFHSFGFTVTLWGVLALGFRGVYHYSPLDARIVGNLCQEHRGTILLGTPTFFRGYAQRCDAVQFATLRLPILGAEKLKPEAAAAIRESLHVEPLEGYGCSETAPVVAVNTLTPKQTPDGRTVAGNRPGTVGMPLPGTSIKTVDPESGADLPAGAEGIVHVKGPQVMAGYLNRPEATAAVVRDGWYATGDLGLVDADGFLIIKDRLSRFSKIGGEMVPHLAIESELARITGRDETALAVTSMPDPKRGERLVVLYTDLGIDPDEAVRRLAKGPLPRLWQPSADAFVAVEAIPVLGSGKVDLRGLRTLAASRLGG